MTEINEISAQFNQLMNKFHQGVKDESKFQRIKAIEAVKKQLNDSINNSNDGLFSSLDSCKSTLKALLGCWHDPVEKCRELATDAVATLLAHHSKCWDNDMSGSTLVALHKRVGAKELKEPSEEIRLKQYGLVESIIQVTAETTLEIYFQDLVVMLVNALQDNYAEVKKRGCTCTRLLANKLRKSVFHMQSETLVKPLLANLLHQHSRVRKDTVDCLCEVILCGTSKPVADVLPHLAQRLFDQAHTVRMAVVRLVGTWLLELADRYSYWHRLMPLLLTGFVDEATEIRELTESLWWDVGLKYEKENDEELKDKASFLEQQFPNYPEELRNHRPNLGCRELVRQNASRILPGLLNDIGDWVEATRIKSVQLLYVMIWQAESNATQHLETILQTLFKASQEDVLLEHVAKCASLVGVFTDPKLTLQIAFKSMRKMTAPQAGTLVILNGLLQGHGKQTPFVLVCDTLKFLNDICLTTDHKLQEKIVDCCQLLSPAFQYDVQLPQDQDMLDEYEYLLFKVTFIVSSLSNNDNLVKDTNLRHVVLFINELKENCDSWNDNSFEPIIFAKLVKKFGLLQEIADNVVHILKQNLNPSKDVQMRTRFLLLIPEIFVNDNASGDVSKSYLEKFFDEIINDMILSNVTWKAGRVASSVRMTAIASLALIIQSDTVKKIKIQQLTLESLVKTVTTTLDDDNKSTRLYVCKIFIILMRHYGSMLDKDQLHKLYPEFIKRLDDNSEEIRFEMVKLFYAYVDCLLKDGNYDRVLYQAHTQVMFENLLLYLDDTSEEYQNKIFDLLKHASQLNPEQLISETNKVKAKHRSGHLCEELIKYCQEKI